jgi:hypothetical protein
MFLEAQKRPDIDILPLMSQSSMPAAEAHSPAFLDWIANYVPADAKVTGIDWIRFGQLLRHELDWDEKYPAYPNFPEARYTP